MCGRSCSADLLPVFFSAILLISVSVSFVIAVAQSDITPWFPAISDTATKSPESNIFGQLVNISTFIGFVLIYVRYLQVKRDVELEFLTGSCISLAWNRCSLFYGLVSILGASFVANFPETEVRTVHDIGAAIFFIMGNIYAWMQVKISFGMKRFGLVSSCVCNTRTVLSVISTVSVFVFLIMSACAARLWDGNKLHWDSDDPGYTVHVTANAFEWLLVFCFVMFILTFTKELRHSKLHIKLVGYRDNYEPIASST